jgi:hypothetical protein
MIIISKFEHLKNKTELLENSIYDKMLLILGYTSQVDCVEVDAENLNLIIQNI